MRTLIEDGIDKAAQGLTTLDEVLRVVSQAEPHEPVRHQQAAPVAAPPPAQAPAAVPAVAARVAAGGQRVLVVEDSPTIVSVVKYFLELEGFEVLVGDNGVTGLEMALQKLPDVIVGDVQHAGHGRRGDGEGASRGRAHGRRADPDAHL